MTPLSRKDGARGLDSRVRAARPFRVLALDPGLTTGVAFAQWLPTTEAVKLEHLDQIEFSAWHIGPGDHHMALWDLLIEIYGPITGSDLPLLEIVYESFEFRQHIGKDRAEKHKVELISKEMIGVIKLFCQVHNITYNEHTASAAKQFIPDKGPQKNRKLQLLGLYQPGLTHGMDAMRHLFRHLIVTKKIRSPITDYWL